jgi:hypothetical protein
MFMGKSAGFIKIDISPEGTFSDRGGFLFSAFLQFLEIASGRRGFVQGERFAWR